MEKTKRKILQPDILSQPQRPEVNFRVSIPYDHVTFGKIKALLAEDNIGVTCSAQRTTGELFSKLKDRIQKDKLSYLVYEITCECEEKYIGKTTTFQHTLHTCMLLAWRQRTQCSVSAFHRKRSLNHIWSSKSCVQGNQQSEVKEMITIKATQCLNYQTETLN